MTSELLVDTAHGQGRLITDRAPRPWATLLLNHGAGAGIDSRDLTALARHLPRQGISVIRFEQPWRRAGRRVATAPPTLDEALMSAYDRLRVRTPLVVGGRSAGARSAARMARRMGAVGCLCLSFPLHPPKRPERSRLEELRRVGLPTLVVQGERDEMGRPEEFPEDLPQVHLAVLPDGDHGLAVHKRGPLSEEQAMDLVVETTLEWMTREVGPPSRA